MIKIIAFLITIILLMLMLLLSGIGCDYYYGVAPFGPEITKEITISRAYVDKDQESSHYMVATTEGEIFEIDNSFWMGITNADEIYGQMKEGTTLKISTRGNKVVGYIFQEYPYIIKAEVKK